MVCVYKTMVLTRSKSCVRQDPLAALGHDALLAVLAKLPAADVARAACVSRGWAALAQEDLLWRALCEELWRGKVYIPSAAEPGLRWQQKYAASLCDSTRTLLTKQELCSFRWTFRFKRTAGELWTALDPYWTKRGNVMRRFFHSGGDITAGPDDPLWGEYETRWRFTKSREGVKGHFVKVNHWPSLSISRTSNWGWRMQNMWVVYEAELLDSGPYWAGVEGKVPHKA